MELRTLQLGLMQIILNSLRPAEMQRGTALTITGGTGGSVSDSFSSPRAGLTDGQTYFAIKVDDHNFKIASTYELATNASPSSYNWNRKYWRK